MAELNVSRTEVMNNILALNDRINELSIEKEREMCPNCELYSETEKQILVAMSLHKCIKKIDLFSNLSIGEDIFYKILEKLEKENLIIIVQSENSESQYLSLTIEGKCAARVFSKKVKISSFKFLSCLNDAQIEELNSILNCLLAQSEI